MIPSLLLRNSGLVKTRKFRDPVYLGDPRNVVKIFNDKEVDELVLLDITASVDKRAPRFDLIREIASECFMPLGYGGGVTTAAEVEKLISIGIEKVVLNSSAINNPELVSEASRAVGRQSIVVSIDCKQGLFRGYEVFTHSGTRRTKMDPKECAERMEEAGAGEILLYSIDRDGTGSGYDLNLIERVSAGVSIPVVACGGAASVDDFGDAVRAGASAVSAGSMFVFQGKHRAVLISFPETAELSRAFTFLDS